MSAEERRKKFEELAEKRINEALRRIRLISKLANKSNYTYTEDHVKQIVKALEDEVKLLKSKFQDQDSELQSFRFVSRAL